MGNKGLLSGLKWNYFLMPAVLFLADACVVYGAMAVSLLLVQWGLGHPVVAPRTWGLLLPVLYMSNLLFADMYRTRRVMADYARKLLKASTFAVVTIVLFDFLLHMGGGAAFAWFFAGVLVLEFLGTVS